MQAKTYIEIAQDSPYSLCALSYIESDHDVYGWHLEAVRHRFTAEYFMLEDYFANTKTLLYRSIEDDVYGAWIRDFPPSENPIHCPLPEIARHTLEQMQFELIQEWLFFQDDPASAAEVAAYRSQNLPLHIVNVKAKRLSRCNKHKNLLIYASPGFNFYIVDFLKDNLRPVRKLHR